MKINRIFYSGLRYAWGSHPSPCPHWPKNFPGDRYRANMVITYTQGWLREDNSLGDGSATLRPSPLPPLMVQDSNSHTILDPHHPVPPSPACHPHPSSKTLQPTTTGLNRRHSKGCHSSKDRSIKSTNSSSGRRLARGEIPPLAPHHHPYSAPLPQWATPSCSRRKLSKGHTLSWMMDPHPLGSGRGCPQHGPAYQYRGLSWCLPLTMIPALALPPTPHVRRTSNHQDSTGTLRRK